METTMAVWKLGRNNLKMYRSSSIFLKMTGSIVMCIWVVFIELNMHNHWYGLLQENEWHKDGHNHYPSSHTVQTKFANRLSHAQHTPLYWGDTQEPLCHSIRENNTNKSWAQGMCNTSSVSHQPFQQEHRKDWQENSILEYHCFWQVKTMSVYTHFF